MYRRILVPLDGSAADTLGLHEALGLAVEHGARLHLLHIVDNPPMRVEMSATTSPEELRANRHRHGKRLLAEAHRVAAAAGAAADTALREVARTRIADAIVEEASECGCDLIVMGTRRRRGMERLTFGNDTARVARLSPVPVLLVREQAAAA
jgi:nucleotide-binding universal stress UspA family protein